MTQDTIEPYLLLARRRCGHSWRKTERRQISTSHLTRAAKSSAPEEQIIRTIFEVEGQTPHWHHRRIASNTLPKVRWLRGSCIPTLRRNGVFIVCLFCFLLGALLKCLQSLSFIVYSSNNLQMIRGFMKFIIVIQQGPRGHCYQHFHQHYCHCNFHRCFQQYLLRCNRLLKEY